MIMKSQYSSLVADVYISHPHHVAGGDKLPYLNLDQLLMGGFGTAGTSRELEHVVSSMDHKVVDLDVQVT